MVAAASFDIGHDCPKCDDGVIGVLNTKIVEDQFRVRYLGCRGCGWRPPDNQRVIPIEFAPKRRMVRRRMRRR